MELVVIVEVENDWKRRFVVLCLKFYVFWVIEEIIIVVYLFLKSGWFWVKVGVWNVFFVVWIEFC